MSGCADCNELNQGPAGYNGWNPVLTQVEDTVNLDTDGQSRIVLQLDSWIGGTGITPTNNVGDYLSTSGFTTTISNATNIKGTRGSGYKLTSITNLSLPISLGSQLIVVDKTSVNSAYTIGARVRVSSRSNPTIHFFEGVVTNYTGTNFTISIDYSTQPDPIVTNIVDWDINVVGESGIAAGFNDNPWIELDETEITSGDGITPTFIFQSYSSTATFDLGSFANSSRIRYKILGKTMFLQYYLDYNCTVAASTNILNLFYIKIPGGKTAMSTFDTGACELYYNDFTGISNIPLTGTLKPKVSDPTYIETTNFVADGTSNLDTAGRVIFQGRIIIEII
jgi:hypothetical protein